jgi:regulation of enolase protein 1 (concanavalin A-like superfamily)
VIYNNYQTINMNLKSVFPAIVPGSYFKINHGTSARYTLTFLLFLCLAIPIITLAQHRDGKLLRGEEWQPFGYPERADFYVSTQGNDLWTGTLPEPNPSKTDGPFLTLRRAQKAVLELKQKVYLSKDEPVEKRWIGSPHPLGRGKDILVYIRGGRYSLDTPLLFGPSDGGERVETNLPTGAFEYHKLRDHYVTYAAYPGEKPVISGAVPVTGWKRNGQVWVAPFSGDTASMLLVDGKRQILARTPNEGYFVPPAISRSTDELYFANGELKAWPGMEDNRVIMLLRWHTGINSLSVVDEKKGVARLRAPQEGVVIVPPRYYVENVKALLDAPGEWYFDRQLKEISYIPAAETDNPGQAATSVPVLNNLIAVTGKIGQPVRNLRFYGLTFEGATEGASAVSFEFAHACEFAGNELRSVSGTGLSVKSGCYQTRIMDNHFETIDKGAIFVKGPDNPKDGREITRETLISRNRLYDCGGINIYASHTLMTTISHNYITKTRGRYAIDVGGWANQEEAIDGGYVVEYNHLDDVQRDADDSGAIKTAGLTFNSFVRRNLVHDVRAGFFNDNVGFWFDNMSSGWVTEENIFYNLEQGEMKLCAALMEDNIYRNNFLIEAPAVSPETIIEGEPVFEASDLRIEAASRTLSGAVAAGSAIRISARIRNNGATGILPVELLMDGRVLEKKPFPVIKNNERTIEFEVRIYDACEHFLAIGTTPFQPVRVEGDKPAVVFEDIELSGNRILKGEKTRVTATARNLTPVRQNLDASLFVNNLSAEKQSMELQPGESKQVSFTTELATGNHLIRIDNSPEKHLKVSGSVPLDLSKVKIHQYCSAKAKPYEIEADARQNRFKITASGSDFFHAEDSYAAAYIKGIKGDFVATVKIRQFGHRTHEWFRAGLFVRNDMARSFDVQPGSKGSVLVFGTPGRAGIEYDEFGNGCMHKASSQNLPENSEPPLYLKMVRQGNSFSGYISPDGVNWTIERHTTDIPGIGESIDLGLAAGAPDKQQYWVEFADWKIEVEKQYYRPSIGHN